MSTLSLSQIVFDSVGLLFLAALTRVFCKRFNLPFTVALVVLGFIIAHLISFLPANLKQSMTLGISPELIIFVFLPALVFESAYNMDYRQLKRNMLPVLLLAIPGLLISTFIIGGIVTLFTPIGFVPALLLGSILSATDPVAVIALFKQLGAPERLTILVEGESLFNDATAVVTSKILMAIVIAGAFHQHHITHGLIEFCVEFFGGILFGWVVALVFGYLVGLVRSDLTLELSITLILAFGTYLVGQEVLHVSGIMATLTAGIIMGGWGQAKISESVAENIEHFWEYLAYISNIVIFLLVGMSVHMSALYAAIIPLAVVIGAMLVSRAIVIYSLVPLAGVSKALEKISIGYQTIMYWGGLRGAIGLAIVMSLPEFPEKELFVALVMGAVLFTLIVQGLSIETVMQFFKLNVPPLSERLAELNGKASAKKYVMEHTGELQSGGLFSPRIAADMTNKLKEQLAAIKSELTAIRVKEMTPEVEQKMLYLSCFFTQKIQYHNMFSKGHLSESTYRELNDFVSMSIDELRYDNKLPCIDETLSKTGVLKKILSFAQKLPLLNGFIRSFRSKEATKDYEKYWGKFQGVQAILTYLHTSDVEHKNDTSEFPCVSGYFEKWSQSITKHLDGITEQFPEFVTAMQTRLAARLSLHAEKDALMHQAHKGSLPEGVAHSLAEEIDEEIEHLKEKSGVHIELNIQELLKKVPFFADLSEKEFSTIEDILHSHVLPENEVIVNEGDKGDSMFFILRGVIRVSISAEREQLNVATLMAGDFFGEMALLSHEPRTATCRSVTPAAIFELKSDDFEKIKAQYPAINKALDDAVLKRKAELDKKRQESV